MHRLATTGQIASQSSNQETVMSSRGKKKTTMAKLNREARLRERRSEKLARKEARRDAAANPEHHDVSDAEADDSSSFPGDTEQLVTTDG
jgi:hypothetical protein